MFSKVLVAEDHECSGFSVCKILENLNVSETNQAYYCDDALAKIKRSKDSNKPFDLMITDLSFEEDFRKQTIKDGKELIKCCRDIDPDLKVIVFSGESRLGVIEVLFKNFGIDAYVKKSRDDAKELKKALEAVSSGDNYLSHDLKLPTKSANLLEFSNYDITLLQLLSGGILQKNIPPILQKNNVSPNSLSSIEKRINNLKENLSVKNNEQLIARCKDLGII